nr:patatin-like phospholipase-like protein [Apis mellifera nudivirus]
MSPYVYLSLLLFLHNVYWVCGNNGELEEAAEEEEEDENCWCNYWQTTVQDTEEEEKRPVDKTALTATTNDEKAKMCKIKTSLRYRNIVFEGGGMKGIAHIGALKALSRHGYYDQSSHRYEFDGMSGSSIGCVFALVTALDISPQQLEHYVFNDLDFYSVFSRNSSYIIDHFPQMESHYYFKFVNYIRYTYKLLSYILRLVKFWQQDDIPGIDNGVHFHSWIRNKLFALSPHALALSRLDYNPTLAQLRDITGHSLTCYAARLGETDIVRLGVDNAPHVFVADVVYASCSLPMLFKPIYDEEGYPLVDGGLLNNFPINEYDHMPNGGNMTLGISLHRSPISQERSSTLCPCRAQNTKRKHKLVRQPKTRKKSLSGRMSKNVKFIINMLDAVFRDRDYLQYTRDPRNCNRVIYLAANLNTLELQIKREQISEIISTAERHVNSFFSESISTKTQRLHHCQRYAIDAKN